MSQEDKHKWTPVVHEGGGEGGRSEPVDEDMVKAAAHIVRVGNAIPFKPEQQLKRNIQTLRNSPYGTNLEIYLLLQGMTTMAELSAYEFSSPAAFVRDYIKRAQEGAANHGRSSESIRGPLVLVYDGLTEVERAYRFIGQEHFNAGRQERFIDQLYASEEVPDPKDRSGLWQDPGLRRLMMESLVASQISAVTAAEERSVGLVTLMVQLRDEVLRQGFDFDPNEKLTREEWVAHELEMHELRLATWRALRADKKVEQNGSTDNAS